MKSHRPCAHSASSDVVEGTVYTILLRLEKNELVNIEKTAIHHGSAQKVLLAEPVRAGRTRNVLGEMGLRLIEND